MTRSGRMRHGSRVGVARLALPLPLLLSALLLLLLLLQCASPVLGVSDAETRADSELRIVSTESARQFLSHATRAYRMERGASTTGASSATSGTSGAAGKGYRITTGYGASATMQRQLLHGSADLALLTSSTTLTAAERQAYPDMLQLPLLTLQTGILTNLIAVDDVSTLTLSLPILSRIFRGDITTWNHTDIAALNPDLSQSMPNETIRVVMGSRWGVAGQMALCAVFNRIDPLFATEFPCTSERFEPPLSKYGAPPILRDDPQDILTVAGNTLFSISFGSVYDATKLGLHAARLLNQAGNVVAFNVLSAQLSALEVGFPLVNERADLTTAAGPFVNPFNQYLYLQLSKSYLRSTCAQKAALLDFVLWMYTSPTAREISELQLSPILPAQVQTALDVVNILQTQVECFSGVPTYTASALQSGKLFGMDYLQEVVNRIGTLWGTFYDSSVAYAYVTGREVQSYALINALSTDSSSNDAGGGISAAFSISTSADPDNGLLHRSLPYGTVGAAVSYTLPSGLNSTTVPALRMDVHTLALLFDGGISSWLDPRIAKFNPELTRALRADSSISPSITLVLCCVMRRGILPVLRRMTTLLEYVPAWRQSVLSGVLPLDWSLRFNDAYASLSGSVRWVMADTEDRMLDLLKSTPGAVGYAPTPADPDDTLYVRLMPWKGSANAEELVSTPVDSEGFFSSQVLADSVAPGVDSSVACITTQPDAMGNWGALDVRRGFFNPALTSYPATCYPVTFSLQMLLPLAYSNSSSLPARRCGLGFHTLTLMRWLVSSSVVSSVMRASGFGMLTDVSAMRAAVVDALERIECDGHGLLVQWPSDWTLSRALKQMGVGWSATGWALVGLALLLLALCRNLAVVQMSGAIVLSIVATGLALLFTSSYLWLAVQNTNASCSAFIWTGLIGFTLAFLPFVLKMWRASRLQNANLYHDEKKQKRKEKERKEKEKQKQKEKEKEDGAKDADHKDASHKDKKDSSKHNEDRRRSKLTDLKLVILLCLAVLVDLILLCAMELSALDGGFRLDVRVAQENLRTWQYSQCTPDSTALPFLVSLLLLKLAWLLWGCLLASELHEDASVGGVVHFAIAQARQLRWTLYNALFTLCIIVPILLLLDPMGDAFALLVAILILWVSSVAWVGAFVPKMVWEWRRRAKEQLEGALLSMAGTDHPSSFALGGHDTKQFSLLPAAQFTNREALGRYMLALDHQIVDAKRRLYALGGLHLLPAQVEYRPPLHRTSTPSDGESALVSTHAGAGGAGGGGAGAGGAAAGFSPSFGPASGDAARGSAFRSTALHRRSVQGGRDRDVVRDTSVRLSSVTNNYMRDPTPERSTLEPSSGGLFAEGKRPQSAGKRVAPAPSPGPSSAITAHTRSTSAEHGALGFAVTGSSSAASTHSPQSGPVITAHGRAFSSGPAVGAHGQQQAGSGGIVSLALRHPLHSSTAGGGGGGGLAGSMHARRQRAYSSSGGGGGGGGHGPSLSVIITQVSDAEAAQHAAAQHHLSSSAGSGGGSNGTVGGVPSSAPPVLDTLASPSGASPRGRSNSLSGSAAR